jgi:hypothetical protein
MTVMLLGMGAIAVDLGFGYSVKRQLSSTADAAALAGAQEAGLKFKTLGGCGTSLTAAVNSAVAASHNANAPAGSTGVPTPTVTCDTDEVTVSVTERSDLDTFFGRVLGVTTLSPAAAATANVFGAKQLSGLRPFTVCIGDAFDARDNGTVQMSTYGQHNGAAGNCNPTGAPGNWGYASFDVGGSQNTLLCLIEFGYGTQCGGSVEGVDVGDWQDWVVGADPPSPGTESLGNTGNSIQPNATNEIDALLGETILLPVGENWAGTGSNATYDGFGAVAVNLLGYILPKPNGDIQVKNFLAGSRCLTDTPTCEQKYEDTKANWTNVSLVIFWEYQNEWVVSYTGQDSSDTCALGDTGCIPALRLTE